MRALVGLLVLLPLLSCDAPGPLKAEREGSDLFARSEEEAVVVEAILIVDAGLPPVRAVTRTPPRMRIARVALLSDEKADGELQEVGALRLSADSEEEDQAPENQLEYTRVIMKAHLEYEGSSAPAAYQFGVANLEGNSPLLIDSEWFEEEDLARRETSPLLQADDDGSLYVPWDGIYYAGRQRIRLYAVDENWLDLVRTDNIDVEREVGEAGQGFQRPLFHVENGIGLFASACVDCDLTYRIAGATTADPCPTCSIAWRFAPGPLQVDRDTGGCGEAAGLEGASRRLAQGPDVIGTEDGASQYSLFEGAAGQWRPVQGGWAMVPEEGEWAGQWVFTLPGD